MWFITLRACVGVCACNSMPLLKGLVFSLNEIKGCVRYIFTSLFCMSKREYRVWINVSWFGKCNALFIFHDTVFPIYPENYDTKEGFCFQNRGTKTKFLLPVKVKNDFHMMHITFLLKQLCCCSLDIRFFSLVLIGVSFCNSFQLYVLFLSVHWYTENCFTITECCFKSVYY